ncbi:PR-1-like protein [Lentithecium fluviatile CBS 122367]|uniref:PR-1-like protein n=1 Tax=Lentithecium fluviatile CBS 122367 TaxID=1168545 RepID=A0A6G1J347_9PLEO|nr:PR-1-like protein [Lentithecium fluviatile CBS 122367]
MHILTTLVATLLCSSYNVRLAVAQQEEQASTEYTKDDEFKDAVMNVSNTYRKQHNATALAWNGSLAEGAAEWSERCVFEHSGGPTGENLSSGYRNASASIIAWGHERVDYDFKKGGFSKETGHFTQLVWKATTSFGCGRTECNGEGGKEAPGWFVVCNYYPPGNVIGAFTENVQGQVPEEEQPEGPRVSAGWCLWGGGEVGWKGSSEVVWVAVFVSCLGLWVM